MLCDPRQHLWTNLVLVVKSEHHVQITCSRENLVRTGFALDLPANSQKRGENALGFS